MNDLQVQLIRYIGNPILYPLNSQLSTSLAVQPQPTNQPNFYQEEDPINLKEWFFRILAYWWLIAISVVLGVAAVWLYHRYAVPRYNVTTTILINQEKNNPSELILEELAMFSGKVNIQNEIGILKSLSLLQQVIDSLDFEVEYYQLGRIRTAEQYVDDSPYKVTVIENNGLNGAQFMIDFLGDNLFKIYPNEDAPVRGLEEQTLSFPAVVTLPEGVLLIERNNTTTDYQARQHDSTLPVDKWRDERREWREERVERSLPAGEAGVESGDKQSGPVDTSRRISGTLEDQKNDPDRSSIARTVRVSTRPGPNRLKVYSTRSEPSGSEAYLHYSSGRQAGPNRPTAQPTYTIVPAGRRVRMSDSKANLNRPTAQRVRMSESSESLRDPGRTVRVSTRPGPNRPNRPNVYATRSEPSDPSESLRDPVRTVRTVRQRSESESSESPTRLAESIGQHKFIVYTPWSLAKSYRKALSITNANKESSILSISMESPLPDKARAFLNKLVEQYIQRELNQKNLTAERTIDFIDQQLLGIQDTLSTIEERLQSFRSSNRIINMSEEGSLALTKFQDLEQRKAEEEIKLEYFDYILKYLREERPQGSMISPATVGVESPVLDALIQNLNQLGTQLTQLELNATEVNPQVKSLRLQVERVMDGIIENVENLKESTEIALQDVNARIREVERSLNQLPVTERAYVNIQRRFTLSENLFIYLQEKKAEAGIAKASNVPENKLLDPAIVMAQTFPNAKRNYALGFMLSFILPVGALVLREYFSNKIQSINDVETHTKLPVLGTLAYAHFDTELVMANHPRSLAAESFRKVRAAMKFLENGKGAKVIMLTSFHSGEGKSFSAMNFATMLAKSDKKVLLLGMDLRKPRKFEELGLDFETGVTQYLIGDKKLKEVVQPSKFEGLEVLLSGPTPPNPNELITGEQTAKLFDELHKKYDYVIIDSAPIGLVSDGMDLAKYVDVTLFIVRHQVTPKNALEYINDIADKELLPKIGIILNGVDFKKFKNKVNFGYGYGYGYGFNKGSGYYES